MTAEKNRCLLYGWSDHDCAQHPGQASVTPDPCTTQAARLLHLSVHLKPVRRGALPGRSGQTLCGETGEDQERLNHEQRRRNPPVIAAMRPCSRCAKKAKKAGAS